MKLHAWHPMDHIALGLFWLNALAAASLWFCAIAGPEQTSLLAAGTAGLNTWAALLLDISRKGPSTHD